VNAAAVLSSAFWAFWAALHDGHENSMGMLLPFSRFRGYLLPGFFLLVFLRSLIRLSILAPASGALMAFRRRFAAVRNSLRLI